MIFSCDQKNVEDETNIVFNVDSTLLAPKHEIPKLQLSFRPPKICRSLPEKFVNKISIKLDSAISPSDKFTIRPIHIFTDSLNEFNCSISQIIDSNSDTSQSFLELHYYQFLKKSFAKENITKGAYVVNGLNITQYLIMTTERIIFKLIFTSPNNAITQIDYAIVRSIYPNFIRHIESSIGSVSTLN